ncbi:putative juxtaposed with another zinc finger protein 1-like [Apostichopus japonicus]|uniref:Putative juxtaposed with another zinc finger protein 1-like n=1 Tax=Stichopus japonicus TaxID=307972 RepID=A0A2G8LDA4_STIJA|nr:putative juxtaposed with another zinc finger protein 1-like [Apostichopus japonicus]
MHFILDNDPSFLEKQEGQQPSALALSYVMRFVTDAAKHQPKEKKKTKLYRGSSPKHLLIALLDFKELTCKTCYDVRTLVRTSNFDVSLILFKTPVALINKCQIKKTYKCDCGKSYRSAQGLRQHVIAQHPPTSLGSSPSPSPKQTIASPAPTATTTITPSIFATGHVGLSLANGSILLEPCTTTLGNAGIVVEPGTPVTPTSQSARLVTPSTPPTGFTIVTLPSASLGKVSSLVSSPRQPPSADCAIRKAQTAIKLESLPLIEKTTTNISAKVQQVKTEGES